MAVSIGSTAAGENNSGQITSVTGSGNAHITIETPDANAIAANEQVSDTAVFTAGQVASNALQIAHQDELAGIQGVVDEADNSTAASIQALQSQQVLAGSAIAAQQTTSGQAIGSLETALETNANLAATTVASEEAQATLSIPAAQDVATSGGQNLLSGQSWQTWAAIATVALAAWYFLKGKPE